MLIAALSVVFHGAFAVMAHPLRAEAQINFDCDGHGKIAVAQQYEHSSHGSHHHEALPASSSDASGRADHHGKVKDANNCCSAVSAALLPRGEAGELTEAKPTRLTAILQIAGDGHAPPTPSKPPRQTYQS